MSDTTGEASQQQPWLVRATGWLGSQMPFRDLRGEKGPWEQKEGLRARITELKAILGAVHLRAAGDASRREVVELYAAKAAESLEAAEKALGHKDHHPRRRAASHLGVAQSHVDTALNLMVWMASSEDIKAMLPQMLALIEEHFAPGDLRRIHATEIARRLQGRTSTSTNGEPGSGAAEIALSERAFLAETVSHARRLLRKETLRVRSFVRIVKSVTLGLFIAALGVAALTCVWETAVPLCFTPESGETFKVVCPSYSADAEVKGKPPSAGDIANGARAADYIIVEIVGVVSAAIAAAATLRRIRGTALPYDVPVALALLKLPMGALTAALGLLLIRGGFVPGLSALDSTAQIIAWAIIFGYSQQLFTKFVDNQAQAVLDAVHGPNSPTPATAASPEAKP